jgi:pantoate--beta-alanine ligase
MQKTAEKLRLRGSTIAFVPTMGYLHQGHISLMQEGRQLADTLVASIFVNPTQFGPGEDYDAYPRDPKRDAALAADAGVDILFMPEKDSLYPEKYETYITQSTLPKFLCGRSRPTHFTGVMTIVAKLFNIVKPNYAIFGQKDFQQLTIIKKMAKDLNFDIKIVGAPIIREPDGLAMSSRNKYLSHDQRKSALVLNQVLKQAQNSVARGQTSGESIVEMARKAIDSAGQTAIDYVELADPETLEKVSVIDRPILMALAVRVGQTRLIDNCILYPPVDKTS